MIQKHFRLLPDNLATFTERQRLVSTFHITGVQVHDAKLVASMIAYDIRFLVTLNEKDFKRFTMIAALNPENI